MRNAKMMIISMMIIILGFVAVDSFNKLKTPHDFPSRSIMEEAMEFVKKDRPTPPVSAIFYAKVAEDIYKQYYEQKDNNKINFDEEYFSKLMTQIKEEEKGLPTVKLKIGTESNEYWVGKDPFSPKISGYPRFLLKDFNYVTPPPPRYGSEEFKRGVTEVKEATENRTSEQNAWVNFYGGLPGTEQPAGIWQNILWQNLKHKKLWSNLNDQEYARVQMLLAQTLADAFMECWKVKYTFQTKRPSMVDKSLVPLLAMPNPPFPSYSSGHSTISFAGATLLSHLYPEKKDIWMKHAETARNSRLWGGIHFSYDNTEGEKLGIEVAKKIISDLIHFQHQPRLPRQNINQDSF